MGNRRKWSNLLFFTGLAVCLFQLWLPAYYVTGDGPCHLYNARVLHDLWSHKNTAFYARFYSQFNQPNPNWMCHVLLAILLFIANGAVAEKMLLTIYIVLFVSGFSALIKRMDGGSNYWQLAIFIFVFHHVLAKGFYNFSLSVAFMFWLIEVWLRYLDHKHPVDIVLFFVIAFLTFFAHPTAFAFGCLTCFTLTFSDSYSVSLPGNGYNLKPLGSTLPVLILCLLPFGLLFARFAAGEVATSSIHIHLSKDNIIDMFNFKCLVNVTGKEDLIVKITFIVLLVLLLYSLFRKWRNGLSRYDGFLISLVFACFLYLFFPDQLFGGSLFIIRAQYVLALFSICCISYLLPPGKIKSLAGLILFGLFIGLSIDRISCREVASEGVKDLLCSAGYIKPNSVVLPLDFSPGGKDVKGNIITDRNWLFTHASDYLGAEQPMILLDNYEANTGYFPLLWQCETNPYLHLCNNATIEALPPYARIGEYKKNTGVTIDYLLLWCYDSSWLKDENFRKFYAEINDGYHIVYRSPTGRSILFGQ